MNTQLFEIIKKVPDPEDKDAFSTLERLYKNDPFCENEWVNVFMTRFHCKPFSYYLTKYQIS